MPTVARSISRLFTTVLGILVALSGTTAVLAGAMNEHNGAAIKGYDPVAYFTDGKAVPGNDAFIAEYEGTKFKFASAEHRDAFNADPAKYLPQYSGFCAYGASQGYKADIDPEAFTLVGEKLYLNYNKDIRAKWSTDIPGNIAKADKNWPTVSQSTKVYR